MGVLVDNQLVPRQDDPNQSLLNYATTLSPEEGLGQHPGEGPPNLSQAILHSLAEVGKQRFGSLVNALTLPYDVYQGKVDPLSGEGFQRVQGLTGLMAGGGLPMAEENAAGIFGGRLAQTRPRITDKITGDVGSYGSVGARQQLEKGVNPSKVFDKTGWFLGADGKPRFEIDDSNMEWNKDIKPGAEYKLGDVLNHPDLFNAYPQLKNVDYREAPSLENTNTSGKIYNWGNNKFSIIVKPSLSEEDKNRTVLHELQHAVQHIEGFASGGTIPVYAPHPNIERESNNMLGEYSMLNSKDNPSEQDLARMEDLKSKMNDYLDYKETLRKTAFDHYRALAGETEARNVENRYSNDYFRTRPPWLTESPPRIEQKLTPVKDNPFADITSIENFKKGN